MQGFRQDSFTWFVDQFLYLLIQVLLASGEGLGPAVPQDGEVLLLVGIQTFLQLGAHCEAPNVHGCDALTDQRQGARVGHRLDAYQDSS